MREELATKGFMREELATRGFMRKELATRGFMREELATKGFMREELATRGFMREELATRGGGGQAVGICCKMCQKVTFRHSWAPASAFRHPVSQSGTGAF